MKPPKSFYIGKKLVLHVIHTTPRYPFKEIGIYKSSWASWESKDLKRMAKRLLRFANWLDKKEIK